MSVGTRASGVKTIPSKRSSGKRRRSQEIWKFAFVAAKGTTDQGEARKPRENSWPCVRTRAQPRYTGRAKKTKTRFGKVKMDSVTDNTVKWPEDHALIEKENVKIRIV